MQINAKKRLEAAEVDNKAFQALTRARQKVQKLADKLDAAIARCKQGHGVMDAAVAEEVGAAVDKLGWKVV